MSDVKLVKQSYNQAKEDGLDKRLELIGIVFGSSTTIPPFSENALTEVNENISKRAEELEATYVFGIEYKAITGSHYSGTLGYGDAYKPTERNS